MISRFDQRPAQKVHSPFYYEQHLVEQWYYECVPSFTDQGYRTLGADVGDEVCILRANAGYLASWGVEGVWWCDSERIRSVEGVGGEVEDAGEDGIGKVGNWGALHDVCG